MNALVVVVVRSPTDFAKVVQNQQLCRLLIMHDRHVTILWNEDSLWGREEPENTLDPADLAIGEFSENNRPNVQFASSCQMTSRYEH